MFWSRDHSTIDINVFLAVRIVITVGFMMIDYIKVGFKVKTFRASFSC